MITSRKDLSCSNLSFVLTLYTPRWLDGRVVDNHHSNDGPFMLPFRRRVYPRYHGCTKRFLLRMVEVSFGADRTMDANSGNFIGNNGHVRSSKNPFGRKKDTNDVNCGTRRSQS